MGEGQFIILVNYINNRVKTEFVDYKSSCNECYKPVEDPFKILKKIAIILLTGEALIDPYKKFLNFFY